jgi:cell division protein FtsQ
LKERVDRLIGIYPQLVERLQNRIESIDMRYPNGLALKAQGLTAGLDSKKK